MDWTRGEVRALLETRGIRLRRRLGQSFLVDPNFMRALARDTGAGPEDTVVEIGAGIGSLTQALAGRARRVWAFEIDPPVFKAAEELLAGRDNVTLVRADGATFGDHVRRGPVRFVSNLPYSDWKRLLLAMLSTRLSIASMTVMLQSDLAERLRAEAGTKDYGPMAVLLRGACDVRVVRKAGKGLFYPPPRVDSTVLAVERKARFDFAAAERKLQKLFAGRRKKKPELGGRRVDELGPAELLAHIGA